MADWQPDARVVPLTEGARGSGEFRGEVGAEPFLAGIYPSCSKHGAMNRLGKRVWRCLVEGCNAGAEIDPPWCPWSFHRG